MINLSSSRDHIFERFDRILEYLSSLDKVSDYDRGRDRDYDRGRDMDRDKYQPRYRERD